YNAVTGNAGSNIRIDANSNAVFLGNVSVTGVTGSGTAFYDGAAVGGPLVNTGASVVDPGGTLDADYIRQNALTVNGAATLNSSASPTNSTRVPSFPTPPGKFVLPNNNLTVDPGSLSAIRGNLQPVLPNGSWTAPAPPTPPAATANGHPTTGLGYAS